MSVCWRKAELWGVVDCSVQSGCRSPCMTLLGESHHPQRHLPHSSLEGWVKIVPFYLWRSGTHGRARGLHRGCQKAGQGTNPACSPLPATRCPPPFHRSPLPVRSSRSSFSPFHGAGGAPGVKWLLEDWWWRAAHDARLFLFSRLHLEDDVVPGKSLTNSLARGYNHLAMNLQLATANLFTSLGKSVLCSNLLHTLTRSSASGLIFSVLCFPPLPFRQWECSAGKNTNSHCQQVRVSPSTSKKNQVCISFYLWRELWT